MSIYYEYVTGHERDMLIESATIENEFEKLNTLYEMTCLRLTQLEKEAELKVLTESGTYDDLTYLYEEAENEVVGQKKNIIMRIIDAIKRFFAKITGKANQIQETEIPDSEMIDVPQDVESSSNAITAALSKIQSAFAKFQSGDYSGMLSEITSIAGTIAVVKVTGSVLMKKIPKKQADAIAANMEKVKAMIEGSFNKITSKIPGLSNSNDLDNTNKSMNPLQHIMSAIDSVLNALHGGVQKVVGGTSNKKEQAATAQAQQQESRVLLKNGLKGVGDGQGGKWLIDRSTGAIRHVDADNKELKIDKNTIPKNILKSAQQLKGRAAAEAADKKKMNEQNANVQSKKAPYKNFDIDKTKIKVYLNPNNAKIYVGNGSAPLNIPENISYGVFKNYLSHANVKGQYRQIYEAYRAAIDGVKAANEEQEKINRQQTNEYVCDFINDKLSNTVMEAVMEDGMISLYKYNVEPQTISDDLKLELASDGYTIHMTDNYYIIY